jgi:cell division protein ZapA
MESVRVVIFGAEYQIKSDVDVETIRQIADFVDSRMAEIRQNTAIHDQLKIAVLSALNIAGGLFECKTKYEESANKIRELQQTVESLNQKIDGAL